MLEIEIKILKLTSKKSYVPTTTNKNTFPGTLKLYLNIILKIKLMHQ